jgi:hypothetical protein
MLGLKTPIAISGDALRKANNASYDHLMSSSAIARIPQIPVKLIAGIFVAA